MDNSSPDYLRAMRSAAWMWITYLASLALVDLAIYASANGPLEPILWYHLINTLPALAFLGLSYSRWLINQAGKAIPSMIALISVAPILVNHLFDLQLPPGPLANVEGMVLRQLPVLMMGLVLVSWHYSLKVMLLYSVVINLVELILAFLLTRMDDPRYFAFYFIILIRMVCFILVGIFINQIIAHLRAQAIRDSLTGLYNRHYLNEFINAYIARAEREKTVIALVLMDIDYFKRFNDTYGHLAGDAMLRAVGKLLEKNTRQGDIACRFGGEEFLLVMPGASLDDAFGRAEQIRQALESMQVKYGETQLKATFSAGVAGYPMHGSTLEGVIRIADDALYEAKQAGRNRVVCSNYKVNEIRISQMAV